MIHDEKYLERRFVELCKKYKFDTLKLTNRVGIPDRLVLLGNGKVIFVELKKENNKPTPKQLYEINKLQKNGYNVIIVTGMNELLKFFEYICK